MEIDKSGLVYCEDCAEGPVFPDIGIGQSRTNDIRLQRGVKLVDYKQFSLNKALTEYMAMDVPSPVTS